MKKNIIYIIFAIFSFSMFICVTNAANHAYTPEGAGGSSEIKYDGSTNLDYSSICSLETEGNKGIRQTFKTVGYLIQIIKWIVPLIIIVLGMIDFGKASISNDDKAINKAMTALIRRVLSGIVIFFIPTIVMAILNVVEVSKGIEKEDNSQFGACTKCLFDPFNNCSMEKSKNSSDVSEGGVA